MPDRKSNGVLDGSVIQLNMGLSVKQIVLPNVDRPHVPSSKPEQYLAKLPEKEEIL